MDQGAFAERLMSLMAMEEGPAKHVELDRLFADVRQLDDPVAALGVQLEMLVNAYNSGRFELAAPHLVRTAALYERMRGTVPGYAVEATLNGVSTAPEVLPANADLSAAQIDGALAKVEQLLRTEGADLRTFELAAPAWPLQAGRLDEAAPMIDRVRMLTDPADPHEAYALADKVMHLRDYDAVLHTLDCFDERDWQRTELVTCVGSLRARALLFLGRFEEALVALDPVRAAVDADADPVDSIAFAEAAALVAVLGDPEAAVGLANHALGLIEGAELDALDTMRVAAHVARALVNQPGSGEIAGQLAKSARETADRFDRRNDSGYQRWLVDRALNLPPAP